jgi:hypothetical protein
MKQITSFLAAFFISFLLSAQTLMSPSEFLGYDIGTQFSRHHRVVEYFQYVAAQYPGQVQLKQYGSTYEGRPLYLATVTSASNMNQIESIRAAHLSQTESTQNSSSTGVVWLSFNVHGNEASSTEASMQTIFELLTKHQDYLDNTVVLIDPCVNPDGRDRYANWFNQQTGSPYDSDPGSIEHSEPWPGGRPNHYLFDLNRDWTWASQIETQYRLKVYHQWLPHVHVDFHEQGINEPYYFAPAAEPFHEIITDWQREFQTQIGKNNAKYFDQNGWLYFTRERFDLLYPAYGDTYPTYLGAIGMTYEQAGHGMGGLGVINDEGKELTLVDRVKHHTVTGLSTVEMTSKNADRLNKEFNSFFDNKEIEVKSYVLRGNKDKKQALMDLLDKHKIKYGQAQQGSASGYDYNNMKNAQWQLSSNDLVVPATQAKGKMIKVLFEANAKLSDSLTYDITAWSLPYAYGLNALASQKSVNFNPVAVDKPSNSANSTAVGYLVEWNSLSDAKFLADLLRQKVKVRFTEKPMSTAGKSFNRGTLIITRGDNDHLSNFDQLVTDVANLHSRQLTVATSGFSTSGPDFGSPDIKLVNPPKVAMLAGNGTSSLSYGALWHFFDQQLKYPVTRIDTNDFSSTDLSKFSTLIIPEGYYGRQLNERNMEMLNDWLSKGGNMIVIGRAAQSFEGRDGFGLKSKENKPDESDPLLPYDKRERESAKNLITGAIFKIKLDNSHPLAFGYDEDYFSLKLDSMSYDYLQTGYNVGYLTENTQKASGFAGSKALKSMSKTVVFGEESHGRGSVIYMIDNPLFRSFWENGKLLLSNAIFFVNNNMPEL